MIPNIKSRIVIFTPAISQNSHYGEKLITCSLSILSCSHLFPCTPCDTTIPNFDEGVSCTLKVWVVPWKCESYLTQLLCNIAFHRISLEVTKSWISTQFQWNIKQWPNSSDRNLNWNLICYLLLHTFTYWDIT